MNRGTASACLLVCGLAAAAAVRAELNCNVGIEFYREGGIRGCVLNGQHRIYVRTGVAVTCADGRWLEQHPDGALARCTLADRVQIDGRECPRLAEARFAPDGALRECQLSGAG